MPITCSQSQSRWPFRLLKVRVSGQKGRDSGGGTPHLLLLYICYRSEISLPLLGILPAAAPPPHPPPPTLQKGTGLRATGCTHKAGDEGCLSTQGRGCSLHPVASTLWPELAELQRGGWEQTRGASLLGYLPFLQLRFLVRAPKWWDLQFGGNQDVSSEVLEAGY